MSDDGTADIGEATFDFAELFFSRTDEAGRIAYGNSVFRRISGYAWDELAGAPHKIVRHPDTPRAVFWLLWRTIQSGQPIGAYVKNRTKDGRAYWVFAIATPVEGGYLSVRLRPSSTLFATIRAAYPALAQEERRTGLAPTDSAALLLAQLQALGFDDYRTFMATALAAELTARDAQLARPPSARIARYVDIMTRAQTLLAHAKAISDAYDRNETVPFNFRVLAAQMGPAGAAIGVISTNYAMLSNEMRAILAAFAESAREVRQAIVEGCFLACTARVQQEVAAFFRAETDDDLPRDEEADLLDRQQADYLARTEAGLADMVARARGFRNACEDMARLATGLEVMRVMGKVECARHDAARERLDDLLHELETFQKTVAAALKDLEQVNRIIVGGIEQLCRHAEAA